MIRKLAIFVLVILASQAWAIVEKSGDFTRYDVILQRKPFGVPPVEPTPPQPGVAPQDSFASYVRLTALVQEEGGQVVVGFVDKKQKDKSYTLAVGEKADDYEVLEADLEQEVAKIRKGTEEQWLSMKVAGAVSAPEAKKTGTPQTRLVPPVMRVTTPVTGIATGGVRRQSRYAAIRRAELEREKMAEEARKRGVFRDPPEDDEDDEADDVQPPDAPPPDEDEEDDDEVILPLVDDGEEVDDKEDEEDEDDVIREAEIQQHLQSYQKELIRQGLPPLPIPLTRKTDEELVKEGVLQPLEPEKDDED